MFTAETQKGYSDLKYYGEPQPSGKIIYILTGDISSYPTQTSIQISTNAHVEDQLGRYINHSCKPNVKIVGFNIVSIKPIKNGNSITFNYNHNEDKMSNPFICNICGKWVKGKFSD